MNFDIHTDIHSRYEYVQEQVSFINKRANITLAGTLAIPKADKPLAAVVLISGMGKNDRDYSILGKKLFFDISDYLAQQGIIVLRYDKRGVGKSEGTYTMDVTTVEFAHDAQAALEYVYSRPEVDPAKVGLIGHSEGGLISLILGAYTISDHRRPAFVVSLAGAVVTNIKDIVAQTGMQLKADGASDAFIHHDAAMRTQLLETIKNNTPDIATPLAEKCVQQYLTALTEAEKTESGTLPFALTEAKYKQSIAMFNSPWFRYFLIERPAYNYLSCFGLPLLALNGDKDWISASQLALPLIEQNYGSSVEEEEEEDNLTIIELPNHNHWFQECKTGAMAEYGTL